MKERFYALYYVFSCAVAVFTVADFLLPCREIIIFQVCNLFATLIIYYNYTALSVPIKEGSVLAGLFFAVCEKMTVLIYKAYINREARCRARALLSPALAILLLASGVSVSLAQSVQPKFSSEKLDDKKPGERAKAADAAGRKGFLSGAGEIIKRFPNENDPVVKIHMLHSLGSVGDVSVVKTLADAASGGATADIRAQACMSLSSFGGDKAAEEALRKALLRSEEAGSVKLSAAYSLMTAFRSSPAALAALEAVLKGGDKPVKLGIIDNLRHVYATKEGKRLLDAAAADKDPEVKEAAAGIKTGPARSKGRSSAQK